MSNVQNWIDAACGAAYLTGAGGVAVALKKYWPKVKVGLEVIHWMAEHLKTNLPAQKAIAAVEMAATIQQGPEAAELRKAQIAAALHLLPQIVNVEISQLTTVQMPVIASMLTDHLPNLPGGPVKSEEVAETLHLACLLVSGMLQHRLVGTIREILTCEEQANTLRKENTPA